MKILTDSTLHSYITSWTISWTQWTTQDELHSYVQPASIDLPVWATIYHCNHKLVPWTSTIEEMLSEIATHEINTMSGQVLYKGQTYLIPTLKADLPEHVWWVCSPKSSLWRIDVLIRTVTDKCELYDRVSEGYTWVIWLEVTPQSFNIIVRKWVTLSQMMLFDWTQKRVAPEEWITLYDTWWTQLEPSVIDDQYILHVWIWNHDLVWYRAMHTDRPINLSKINEYDPNEYFKTLQLDWSAKDKLILQKDMFYILPTYENIVIPKHVCVEMLPFSQYVWELRAHYAGFFDPGFGMDAKAWASGVLEVRPHETLHIRNRQPICLMKAYELQNLPSQLYAKTNWNTYSAQQGPKLSKYFK